MFKITFIIEYLYGNHYGMKVINSNCDIISHIYYILNNI